MAGNSIWDKNEKYPSKLLVLCIQSKCCRRGELEATLSQTSSYTTPYCSTFEYNRDQQDSWLH